jgi:heterotetrameric sarcosine oxidase delta subunit
MRIPCPFCGDRDSHEFVYRGDAAPTRPTVDDEIYDYVYVRENPAGPIDEHWYHAQGCRQWIRVRRDTRSHAIFSAAFAGEAAP